MQNNYCTIESEIQVNSLEYGVAVNTDRSTPDAKSGLKPVAKRIIYGSYIGKRFSNKPHSKCARIVGDVMGSFHPHGDSSIYGAMIRLSQPWVMRYPLIDIHGNNGNILGDGPAAMRYTEARLTKLAEDGLLEGLKKKNVDFIPNYDETEEEPVTLPAIFPNLLCNPNEGIGWAMGCCWAPHNLREVGSAIFDFLDGKEPMLLGPDFPTGGIIINKDDIPGIMRTGHGSVKVRGKYTTEDNKIIFYQIPYGTRVESLMEDIGKASDEGKIPGIIDVRNETGKKNGLKLVIEVDKNTNLKRTIDLLFSKTNLQSSFSYNQIALVDKVPTELNLKQAIEVYVNHNKECIVKEAKYDYKKAETRLSIVVGLIRALSIIDELIEMIKKSSSSSAALTTLIEKYSFTELQAKAILDMKLSRLAKLEKVELENEKTELEKLILKLKEIMNNPEPTLRERLKAIVDKYGDDRRTELTQITVSKEEKEIAHVEPEKCVVVMNKDGTIKRIPSTSFRTQKRNGKGVKTLGDIVKTTIRTNTIDSLMIFTDKGNMYRILVDEIPTGTNTSKGTSIKSLIEMDSSETPVLIYSIYRDTDAKYLLFTTKNGTVKKTLLEEYIKTKRKTGMIAINLREGDSIASVNLIKDEPVVILTQQGMGIKFNSTDCPISARATMGVKGISLKDGDSVVATLPIRDTNDCIAIFCGNGLGKRVSLTELPLQKRAGKGVIMTKEKSGIISGALVNDKDNVLIIGSNNSLCISCAEMPVLGRTGLGNQMIKGDIKAASKI